MGVCNCSMFCCTLLYVHYSIAIILMGNRELIALLNLSSWCLVMVERLFLAVPRGSHQFVIVVFPDHTHYYLLLSPFDFFDIVGGNKLRRMWLHCLRSPCDFFRRKTLTKPYRDLTDIVRQPQVIVLSSRPPHINRMMPVR